MADKKISQLPSLTDAIALDDLFVVVDQAPVCTTKNVTFQIFKDSLGLTNFVTTASFNAFTASYQIDSASWNLTDNQLKASASAISASFALFDLDYQIDSASWNARLLAAEQCCATSSLSIAALNAHSGSISNWTGSSSSNFAGTAATASYINVVSSNILVSWTGSTLNLTSNQAENQTLQAVTTAGNSTSGSIIVTGPGNIQAPSFTGSLLGVAASASYIKVTGSGVLVNWASDLLQLTSSIDPNDYLKVSASYAQASASLNANVNSLFVSASELTASLSLLSSSYLNFSASISDRAYKEELSSSRFEAASASVSAINIWTSSLSQSVQAINAWSSSVLLSNLTSSFVLTSSYQIDSASWNNKYLSSSISASAIAYSASLLSASNAVINIWTSSLSQSVQAINIWTSSLSQSVQAINAWSSSVMLDSEFLAWTLSPSASFAGTASFASRINVTGSNVGVNWVGDQLQLSVTPTDLSGYKTTASFDAWTLSPSASFAGTASNANLLDGRTAANFLTTGSNGVNQSVYGGFIFGDGAVLSGSRFIGTASLANNAELARTASLAILALTASYVALKGKGVIIGPDDPLAITSSILTVNGKYPDASGNISTALTNVIVGTSASLDASGSGAVTGSLEEGTVWVIAGDANPNNNGKTFVYDSGSNGVGAWYPLDSFDYATADARYLRLDGSNSPMQGIINMGGYKIQNLADPSLGTDAVNLQSLTAAVNNALAFYTTTSSFNAFTGSYNTGSFTGSFNGVLNGTASHANNADNALTASHIDLVGQYITVNKFGSQFQITGSDVSGFLTTSSFNSWTGSKFEPLSQSLLTASINLAAASASVQAINAVTQSFLTDVEYNLSSSIFISTGSASSIQTIDGRLTVNNLTGSLFGNASFATTASYVNLKGNGITVNYNGSEIQLSASIAAPEGLQETLTAGNTASGSINLTGNITATSFTGSLLGTAATASYFLTSSVTSASLAQTASYVNVVGKDITVNWNGSQLQISASEGYQLTSSFNAWTGSNISSFAGSASYANNAASASYFLTSSVTSASLAQSASYITGSGVWGPYGSNSVISASHAVTSSYSLSATYAATASYTVNQIFLTASSAISILNVDANGYGQDGRISIIGDGASGSVTITTDLASEPNFCAAYLKHGGGAINFVAGAGSTLIQTDNTDLLSGKAGSSATINRVGNMFYLRINNAS